MLYRAHPSSLLLSVFFVWRGGRLGQPLWIEFHRRALVIFILFYTDKKLAVGTQANHLSASSPVLHIFSLNAATAGAQKRREDPSKYSAAGWASRPGH